MASPSSPDRSESPVQMSATVFQFVIQLDEDAVSTEDLAVRILVCTHVPHLRLKVESCSGDK